MDDNWTTSTECPGYRSKTIQYGSCTIVVYRPILDQEETRKRERQVCTALEHSLKNYFKRKEAMT